MRYITNNYNLIFDFDGTIASYKNLFSENVIKKFFSYSHIQSFDTFVSNCQKATCDFDFIKQNIIKDKQHAVLQEILNLNKKQVSLSMIKSEIKNVLKSLSKQFNLFIITGRDYESTHDALKLNDIEHYFIDVICANADIKPKPNPAKGKKLIKKYKLNLNKTMYIGDKDTDEEFSINLKCMFIGASWLRKQYNNNSYCNDIKLLEDRINYLIKLNLTIT